MAPLSTARKAGIAGTVALGTLLVPGTALASTTPARPNYTGSIQDAVSEGTKVITDNVLLLFALPAIWVGYKVARKVISKVG